MHTVSVLLIDDNTTFTRFAKQYIETDPHLSVAATAHSAKEGLALVPTHRPEAIVLDLAMPDMNGFDALPALREIDPDVPIIVLSMHDDPKYVENARGLGATAFVSKKTVAQDLLPTLRALLL
jgi:DNA-binding NarL/FixJ family response regulator